MSPFVVAIDGPAAAGKSTTARLVAERLGFLYLDTGAMYRALTWRALERGIDLDDAPRLTALAESVQLEMQTGGAGGRVILDGIDVTDRIREPRISQNVSRLSRVAGVRHRMVQLQRKMAQAGLCVVEGRDIGTVVFPEAPVKIFLAATLPERARRRREELAAKGVERSQDEMSRELSARDALDSEREESPLRRAEDAVIVDTTGMTIERQVEAVVRIVRDAMARGGAPLER